MKTQRNILIAFILNLVFSVFELFGGLFTGSVAIMSDAVHDLGDAVSIGVSYFLERKSKKAPDQSHSYGYGRYSVLGAAITNLILLVGSAFVIYQAVMRLIAPVEIHAQGMVWLALLGAAMNLAATWFTRSGESMNEKAVNLHMLEDVLGWLVVLIGAVVIRITDFWRIDPLMSIAVALFILYHALTGMGRVLDVFMEKTPDGIDVDELIHHIQHIDHVEDVHHLHIWSLDGMNHCATVHIRAGKCDAVALKAAVREEFEEHGVAHVTVELEEAGENCGNTHCEPAKQLTHGHHHHHHHHGHHH